MEELKLRIYVCNFSAMKFAPNPFAITAKPPDWYKGKVYTPLAPRWSIVKAYKDGKITEFQYTIEYFRDLKVKGVTPQSIIMDLGEPITFVCYEAAGSFCHRYLIAKWFEKEFDIKVMEIVPPKKEDGFIQVTKLKEQSVPVLRDLIVDCDVFIPYGNILFQFKDSFNTTLFYMIDDLPEEIRNKVAHVIYSKSRDEVEVVCHDVVDNNECNALIERASNVVQNINIKQPKPLYVDLPYNKIDEWLGRSLCNSKKE